MLFQWFSKFLFPSVIILIGVVDFHFTARRYSFFSKVKFTFSFIQQVFVAICQAVLGVTLDQTNKSLLLWD